MRDIHPITWIGLVLNILIGFMYIQLFNSFIDPEVFSKIVGAEIGLEDLLRQMKLVFFSFLLFQIIAVAVLILHPRVGLLMAVSSSLVPIPFSLVFALGTLLSYNALKYKSFERNEFTQDSGYFYPNSQVPKMFRNSLITFIISLICLTFGSLSIGLILSFIAPLILFMGARSRKLNPLEIYQNRIVVQPGLFARQIVLRYENIRSALILAGEVIQINVNTEEGVIPVDCPLQNILPEQRKAAVEILASVLEEHGIELH